MPEGHSVHRIALRLDEMFSGEVLAVSSPQGRFATGAQQLDGREFIRAIAVGKQMFVEFTGELWLRVHLGLYGAWDLSQRAEAAHATSQRIGQTGEYARTYPAAQSLGAPRRVRLGEGEDEKEADTVWPPEPVGAVRLRLCSATACADLRGPTACEVLDPAQVDSVIASLGPDPLVDRPAAGRRRFAANVSAKRTPIGALLMDQSVVAGIGNIYRAEILFRQGVNPYIPGSALREDQIGALWRDWAKLLPIGVKRGLILTRSRAGVKSTARLVSERPQRHWVYGRAGEDCYVCGTPIALELMQNRKLFWCPSCQPR